MEDTKQPKSNEISIGKMFFTGLIINTSIIGPITAFYFFCPNLWHDLSTFLLLARDFILSHIVEIIGTISVIFIFLSCCIIVGSLFYDLKNRKNKVKE